MPGFYGFRSVLADWRKQLRTGKVTSGTLVYRPATGGTASITWNNLYIHPQRERSGFMGKGHSDIDGVITLYRTSETVTPRVDDNIVVSGHTYLITDITERLNADVSANLAVYDCTVAH